MNHGFRFSYYNKKLIIGVLVFIFVTVLSLIAVQGLSFHLINIDPSSDYFPDSTPVVFATYNKPLQATHITISIVPHIDTSYNVVQKKLIISLHGKLSDTVRYRLTIQNVHDTTGSEIVSSVYTFTPQSIPLDQLSSEIQDVIHANQDANLPWTRNSTMYNGADALSNQGLSLLQVDALKQAIFTYGLSLHKKIHTVTIDPQTVAPMLPGPNDPAGQFTMNFMTTIDSIPYTALAHYKNVTQLQLQLYNVNHILAYDSGMLDDSNIQ